MSKVTALLGVILLAFAGWSGWWWIGSTAKQTALEGWLAERRADGWVAEGEVRVAGYPNRFDMTVRDLTLADPAAGWAWAAPEFRTYMLSWEPNRVIADWPGVHVLSAPGAQVEAEAGRLRASAAFAPVATLAIERAVVEAEGLALRSDQGWEAGLARGQLSVRRSEVERGRANAYDAVLEGSGLRPPEAWRDLFGRGLGEGLPDEAGRLRLDLTAAMAAPLDRRAVETSDFRAESIWLRPSVLEWGPLRLEARGRLDMDEFGRPSGRINLTARNWRAMLDAAVAAGALDANLAEALRSGLGLLALLSADRESLEAPLRFSEGMMFLGPVPLGQAPRL